MISYIEWLLKSIFLLPKTNKSVNVFNTQFQFYTLNCVSLLLSKANRLYNTSFLKKGNEKIGLIPLSMPLISPCSFTYDSNTILSSNRKMTRMNRIDVWEFFEPQEVCNMQKFLVRINRFFKENKIKKASGGQPKKWLAVPLIWVKHY